MSWKVLETALIHLNYSRCYRYIYVVFICKALHKSLLLSINIGYITVENTAHQGQTPTQGSVFSASSVANICENKGTHGENNISM